MLLKHNVIQMWIESSLHTHSVSTAYVIKAVKRLKTDKYNYDGKIMSSNFQHGTYLLLLLFLFIILVLFFYTSLFFTNVFFFLCIVCNAVCKKNVILILYTK